MKNVKPLVAALLHQKCPECGDSGTGWPGGICQTCHGGRTKAELAAEYGFYFEPSDNCASSYAGRWVDRDDE